MGLKNLEFGYTLEYPGVLVFDPLKNLKKPTLDHNDLKNYRPVSNLAFL